MPDGNSKRLVTKLSDREKKMVADAKKFMEAPNYPKNKVAQWLSEPNVKAFNKIMLEKAFSTHVSIEDTEKLKAELYYFFQCCYDNDIVPSIASMCTWLGIHKDTIYTTIANKGINADLLREAVDFCHGINENGAISGTINSVLYMFLSKNYYGMHDNSTINLTTNMQDQIINNENTMKVIQEQIALENTSKTENNTP